MDRVMVGNLKGPKMSEWIKSKIVLLVENYKETIVSSVMLGDTFHNAQNDLYKSG